MMKKLGKLVLILALIPWVVAVVEATTQLGGGSKITATIDQGTPGTTNKVSIGTDGTVTVNALPSGSATIGLVKLDTAGNTVKVDASNNTVVLGAGSAVAGKVGIDQTTDGTTNKVYIGGNAGTSLPVSMTPATSAPVISTKAVANTDWTMYQANACLKGIECESLPTNSADICYNFGNAAVAGDAAVSRCLKAGANWQPPVGTTSALHVIAADTSNPVFKCTCYP